MTSQKIGNLLNLALDATETERLRSVNLQVGYNEMTNTWGRHYSVFWYAGTCVGDCGVGDAAFEKILAIVRIREENIEKLASLEEVIYIEKSQKDFSLKWQTEEGCPASMRCRHPVFV